jgi:UDP-N-acetylmuramoyl-L-alanyl-D-glutamate--2,6-diaminopimelate ligase
VVVLTSDNPRSEDPDGIIEAVASGIPPTVETITEPDRRLAIRTAGDRARAGDLVLILGKGHETGQEVAGAVLPFDDRLVVGEEIGAANGGAGS